MNNAMTLPLVGIPSDRHMRGDLPFLAVGEKYVTSLRDAAQVTPIILPAPAGTAWSDADCGRLLAPLHGVLFPGSASNVDPSHYGSEPPHDPESLCPSRDALTLPLIRRAIALGIPVLAICRGCQELNVALGGTLHQHVAGLLDLPGAAPRLRHQASDEDPYPVRYAAAHAVSITPGGRLEKLVGSGPIEVNSLHDQAIGRLAPGLQAEAVAPDGLIEAVSLPGADAFVIGVQWHPDYEPLATDHHAALFAAFGDAVRQHQADRAGPGGRS